MIVIARGLGVNADDLLARLDATFGEGREWWDHQRWRRWMRHPWLAISVAIWVARLPVMRLDLEDGATGDAIRASMHLGTRMISIGRFARSVLDIPPDGSYRRGRARRALRTNVRRAEQSGACVRRVPLSDALVPLKEIVQSRGAAGDLSTAASWPSDSTRILVAFQGETPLAYAAVVVCGGGWAWLCESHSRQDPLGGDARWLVHAEMVDDLAAEGVRHLLVESALRLSPGLRAFQQMTGFRAVNLRVR